MKPKHIASEYSFYFVTTATSRREPLFLSFELGHIVISSLYFLRSQKRIKIHGFVVMPDHFHFIISLTEGQSLPKIIHSLKSYTAKAINRKRNRKGKVWQDGYYDYGIRSEKDLLARLGYMLENPLRKDLAEHIEEYELSSGSREFELDPF